MADERNEDCTRVDLFSVSGGVGKTSLAVRLAQLEARRRGAPILLVDADIAGPCIGDILEGWASPPWDSATNLLHLVCGRPEYLPEQLRPGKLPVYRVRDECPAAVEDRAPRIVSEAIRAPAILFCPSHVHTTSPRIEPAVVYALLGHESAGGWIGYVIDEVIRETMALMEGRLSGVIVDHGSSLGALQSVTLRACFEAPPSGPGSARRAVMVTTLEASPLASARDLSGRLSALATRVPAASRAAAAERMVWVVNRVPPGEPDFKASIKRRYPRNDAWVDRALPVRSDPGMSRRAGDAVGPPAALDEDLERLRGRVFG